MAVALLMTGAVIGVGILAFFIVVEEDRGKEHD